VAGFQVSISGRIWVSTEGESPTGYLHQSAVNRSLNVLKGRQRRAAGLPSLLRRAARAVGVGGSLHSLPFGSDLLHFRLNVEGVLAARPDLVLLYASDDNRDAARRLRAAGAATAAYRVDRIADFRRVTLALGALTGDTVAARATVDSVGATIARVRAATAALPRPSVFWPLYDQPLLATGGGSFLNELIDVAGGSNVYGFMPEPSPRITVEDLLKRDPEVILLSPESRARYVADPRWRALRAVRENRLLAVDTTLVYRPGPRLGEAARSVARLLHPGVVK